MEQKQLDELDESFGEEFIEDEPLNSEQVDSEIDWLEPESDLKSKKMKKAKKILSKKNSEKTITKRVEEKKKTKESDEEFYFPKKKEFNFLAKEKVTEKLTEKPKEEEFIEIKSAKESVPLETSSPVDPWAEEGEDSGLFKEASTWKAITGIAVILLIFSIFTQGFDFSEKTTITGATVLSLSDAEEEVLNYVNTQLLQEPFQAEVVSSSELDNLYLFTLSVAGQTVDSYLTKDGKLFFPQGFEMGKPAVALEDASSEAVTEPVGEESGSNLQEETLPEEIESVEEPVGDLGSSEESAEDVTDEDVTDIVLVTLNAKKWVFTPNKVQADKGDIISLTIIPADMEFTFSIPELGIEQEVAGVTKIKEFAVGTTGTFEFNCASCEAWRGMTGTLVVK
ncbi:MAG: hypothetical protein AABW48_00445 [Nanoarchaeota archaeon]